ncbi:DUF1102 domain-containing protein [Halorubrum tebenquichense]|uniref:DUF1102 domain-containing protein n=1 Tax=Halorubrum tebenquichense TaxID=119434 RepID=UPI0009E19E69|nr:DUF1102 domain-containing protein [Halorubrum tebenquichense]
MERRKFVVGLGALASGSAAAVGTGAFTSVTATRDIDVEVADDASAYLRLEGTGGANSDYVTDDGNGGTLAISLASGNSSEVSGGGDGVNPDAVTQIDDLFTIENQGTQEVNVSISKTGDNSGLVSFYPEGEAYDGNSLSGTDLTLSAGTGSDIWVEVDTEGASNLSDGDELLDSVTFTAEATS